MPRDDPDRLARRAARANWPVRIFRSGEDPPEEPFLTDLSVEERLVAAAEITDMCWAVAGKRIPDLARQDWPIKIIRRSRRD